MKQLIIAAVTGLITLGAHAQVTEDRQAYDVTKIDVKNGIEVIFTQNDTLALKVETGTAQNLSSIATEYDGNTLRIYIKGQENNSTATYTQARVYVAQKNVTVFKAAGAASIKLPNDTNFEQVSISLASGSSFIGHIQAAGSCSIKASGGAGFRGKVVTDSFKGDATNGGYIKLMGQATTASIYCSGGSVQAGKFVCNRADVFAKNASSVFIGAGASIKADADSSSSITYYGDPVKIDLGTNAYAVKRDNFKFSLN
ncbi:GIN domain-containing protein [Flavobacterium zepuense]|nr:DUF2807 domain-containing protein [Flavobacterium zepuense]